MSNNFRVGQKVVQLPRSEWPAICAKFSSAPPGLGLREGGIYTIKDIYWFVSWCGLKFVEVDPGYERYLLADCFRPAVDISIFTKMLKQKPKKKVLTMAGRDIAMQRGKFQV